MSTTAIERCIAFTQQEATSDIPRVVSKARKELRALTETASEAERLRARVAALEAALVPSLPRPFRAPEDDGLED